MSHSAPDQDIGPILRVVDAVRKSALLFMIAFGLLLIVIAAILQDGAVAGLMAIEGALTVGVGVLSYGAIWLWRRFSTTRLT